MARKRPNIDTLVTTLLKDRQEFKNFINKVIEDTFIYSYTPNSISLDNATQTLFTVNLTNKRFVFEILEVDDIRDYIDVYLFGVKQSQDRYNVEVSGNNIIVTFFVDITRVPTDVLPTNFEVKGKISEIL